MVRLAELEKSSRLQRFIWTEEYVCLKNETVVIESFFVLEDSEGGPIKMVRGGLTPQVLILAECLGRCQTRRESIRMSGNASSNRFLNIENDGLDDMELLWLLPLENIHLTVSKKAERHDLRVLRLRFCSGKLYNLELSEGADSDRMWGAWTQCLVELNRYRRKMLRGLDPHFGAVDSSHSNVTGNQSNNKSTLPDWRDSHPRFTDDNICGESEESLGVVELEEGLQKNSLAGHLVSHFKDHLRHSPSVEHVSPHTIALRKHPSVDQAPRHNIVTPEHTSTDYVSHQNIAIRNPSSIGELHGHHEHRSSTRSFRGGSVAVSSSSSIDTTTESEGSAFSATSLREHILHINLEETFRVCLFIGDYFGQFLFEAGMNGLPQRMASMSAMKHFMEADDCNMDSNDVHFGFGVEKDALRRCDSLPDKLNGEASFVEDLKQVDDVTHRASLAYLDLASDDDAKQAHVINGHVMLITPEEFRLFSEVKKHREQPMDLRFATARHPDVVRKRTRVVKELHTRRGAMTELTDEARTGLHHLTHRHENSRTDEEVLSVADQKTNGKTESDKKREKRGHRLKSLMRKRKKYTKHEKSENASLVPAISQPSVIHHYEYIGEIGIEDVARELTAIDEEMFLRVHEAELINCMWLRDEKHHRAPNMTAFIEFFHRVFGIVVTEILLPIKPSERAEVMARFTRIAHQCFVMKNFHSTKVIISALQTPAIQRLKETWGHLERVYPESYRQWQSIYHVMSDEGSYQTYVAQLKEAMGSPPCLPFLGPFLKQTTEYYMKKLRPRVPPRPITDQEEEQSSPLPGSRAPSTTSDSAGDQDDQNKSMADKLKEGISSSAALLSRIGSAVRDAGHESASSSQDDFHDAESKFSLEMDGLPVSISVHHQQSSVRNHDRSTVRPTTPSSPLIHASNSSELYLPRPRMTPERKRHIQRLIVERAKHLADRRCMEWNPKRNSGKPGMWDAVLDEVLDWSSLFKKVNEAKDVGEEEDHKFSELALLAREKQTHGYCLEGISSELDITSTLFHFQLAVVRYRIKSDESVRDFLMRAHYNSDVDNFALSLRREPPCHRQQQHFH